MKSTKSLDQWRKACFEAETKRGFEGHNAFGTKQSNGTREDEEDDDGNYDDQDDDEPQEPSEESYLSCSNSSESDFLSANDGEDGEEVSTSYSDADLDESRPVTQKDNDASDHNSDFLSDNSEDQEFDDDAALVAEFNVDEEVPLAEKTDLEVFATSQTFQFDPCFKDLRRAIENLEKTDTTAAFLIMKFLSTFDILKKSASDTSKPVFLFKDGPVTLALKEDKSLFLEDVDLPSQAVIERLNSLLEPGRALFLSEDITVDVRANVSLAGQVLPGIQMSSNSAIFATVHAEASEGINLSPALRSRFSEIIVSPSGISDVLEVAKNRLEKSTALQNFNSELFVILHKLAEGLQSEHNAFSLRTVTDWLTIVESLVSIPVDVRNCYTSCEFDVKLLDLVAVASKIILVDQCVNDQKSVVEVILKSLDVVLEESGSFVHGDLSKQIRSWLCDGAEALTAREVIWEALEFLEPVQQWIRVRTLPVAAKVSVNIQHPVTEDHVKDNFGFTATPTCIDNFVRVVVSLSSNLPLLLQGPPGIGKTAIVQQCGDLFGYTVERINFTKDTTLESLIGAYVPTWNGTKLVFQWRAGKALTALESGHFLLLDEINLASQEVLDELKTMMNPRLTSYFVKGLGRSVAKHSDFRLFATMNPQSVSGGRTKLPRSIENAFLKVQLQDYYREEEKQICVHQFVAKKLVPGLLRKEDVAALLNLHFEVKTMISRREIGRRGGPYELNVRDLLKVGDVLAGNMQTQLSHMELSDSVVYERDNARVMSIRTATSMVYCRLFHGREDQARVQERINKHFPLSQHFSEVASDRISIDSNLPNITRIGFVYLAKGRTESTIPPLVRTIQLKEQLQVLGCAVASGRAVVLEGETCSRKTALVYELARLCQRRLHVFSLTTEAETDILIGRWVPFKPVFALQKLVKESLAEFEKMLGFILNNLMQCGPQSLLEDIFVRLAESVDKAWRRQDGNELDASQITIVKAEKVANALNVLAELSEMLHERLQLQAASQLRRKVLVKYSSNVSVLSKSGPLGKGICYSQ